jgi:hypothetical protein
LAALAARDHAATLQPGQQRHHREAVECEVVAQPGGVVERRQVVLEQRRQLAAVALAARLFGGACADGIG